MTLFSDKEKLQKTKRCAEEFIRTLYMLGFLDTTSTKNTLRKIHSHWAYNLLIQEDMRDYPLESTFIDD